MGPWYQFIETHTRYAKFLVVMVLKVSRAVEIRLNAQQHDNDRYDSCEEIVPELRLGLS